MRRYLPFMMAIIAVAGWTPALTARCAAADAAADGRTPAAAAPRAAADSTDLTRWVNPLIGTAGGGNTFPGAVRPWGMVSVSPHTAPTAPSGYYHGEPWNYGFGMVHLSGTGCADLGSIIVAFSRDSVSGDPARYRSRYSDEQTAAGYYSCRLSDRGLRVEVTAAERSGMLRIVPEQDGDYYLLLDAGRNLSIIGGGAVAFPEPGGMTGYNIGGGFCGENNRHRVYFATSWNFPEFERGLWIGDQVQREAAAETTAVPIGGWLRFHLRAGQPLLLKVGISYVSAANAQANLDAEIPDWDFERIRREALAAWQRELAVIRLSGGTNEERTAFYTALYHALIHPNIISDVNGEYPLMAEAGTGRNPARPRYSVFSLWDTYRTLHPLLTLFYPGRQLEIIRSMLDIYRESGYLPKWELAADETFMMVGDGATPVICDSWIKGLRDFDLDTAWQAMSKPVFLREDEEAPPIRAGYHELVRYGYIPFEQDTTTDWWVWGPVSTTLEYNLADWTLAQLARSIGRTEEAAVLERRSGSYRRLFDSTLQLIRPRHKDGAWLTPYDPLATEGSGSWRGSGGPGFVEGNAWNYTWFVPHDIPGLMACFGGAAPFARQLQRCFDNGQFTITNEPDIAYPYLFTWVPGEEWRTARLVAGLCRTHFRDHPGGLPGNDDCGTISAWYIFSALGFYPACPAAPEYRLGAPLFDQAEIHLDQRYWPGATLRISAGRRGEAAMLNGQLLEGFSITHDQIVRGGELRLNGGKGDE